MSTSASLRRSLRKIPAFRSLPGEELETIIDHMICKEYKPGDVLWRTSTRTDFFGIIQTGEVIIEHIIYGSVIRSTRLSAGDFVLPRNLKGINTHSVVLARAITSVNLYVLRIEKINILKPKWLGAEIKSHSRRQHNQYFSWSGLWIVVVAILIIFSSWGDMTRIVSGNLYLDSSRTSQSAHDDQKSMGLIEYAESIDQRAVFAHNREGYIWYHRDDLKHAEAAFGQALGIDHTDGPTLNNIAVTYFTTKQIPLSTIYLKKAVENDADSAIVKYNYGITLMTQNRNTEAIREFKEVSFIDPTWALPYIQLGFIYIQSGDYVNAEQAARDAITLDATQQSAHLILAISLSNLDKNQEALRSVENAIQIDPNNRVSMFYKARILSNLGEDDTALSILEQLLKSASDPQQISRITVEIEAIHRSQQNSLAGVK